MFLHERTEFCICSFRFFQNSEYDQENHNQKPQITLWYREEEPINQYETPGRQIKQNNQLSLPHQDDCNKQNIEQLQTPTMGVTLNKKSTTTEPPP